MFGSEFLQRVFDGVRVDHEFLFVGLAPEHAPPLVMRRRRARTPSITTLTAILLPFPLCV
jgi:hypothetical protein